MNQSVGFTSPDHFESVKRMSGKFVGTLLLSAFAVAAPVGAQVDNAAAPSGQLAVDPPGKETGKGLITGGSIVDSPEFRDTAKELRCPTCVGLSVLDSDAPFSVQIKDQVREQMEAGKSHDEIMAFFTERYGPWILRVPPDTGFNILAWIVPIVLLCLGPPAMWFFVWRKRRTVATFGIKSVDVIIREMQTDLARVRADRSGGRVAASSKGGEA